MLTPTPQQFQHWLNVRQQERDKSTAMLRKYSDGEHIAKLWLQIETAIAAYATAHSLMIGGGAGVGSRVLQMMADEDQRITKRLNDEVIPSKLK